MFIAFAWSCNTYLKAGIVGHSLVGCSMVSQILQTSSILGTILILYGAQLPLKPIVHKIHHAGAMCTRLWASWALGLRALCVAMCSTGPTNLAQANLDAHSKPKNSNEVVMTWVAKVRSCRPTLTWSEKAVSWEGKSLDARYRLGKDRCQTDPLTWEPVLMPFLPPFTPN